MSVKLQDELKSSLENLGSPYLKANILKRLRIQAMTHLFNMHETHEAPGSVPRAKQTNKQKVKKIKIKNTKEKNSHL